MPITIDAIIIAQTKTDMVNGIIPNSDSNHRGINREIYVCTQWQRFSKSKIVAMSALHGVPHAYVDYRIDLMHLDWPRSTGVYAGLLYAAMRQGMPIKIKYKYVIVVFECFIYSVRGMCVICTCLRCCDAAIHIQQYMYFPISDILPPHACSCSSCAHMKWIIQLHVIDMACVCGVCVLCCIIHIKFILYVYSFTCLTLPFIPCYYYFYSVFFFLRSCGVLRAHIANASKTRMALLHFDSIFDAANAFRSHIGLFNVD